MPQREKLPDIQSLPDNRNIPLDRVGVKGLHWPVTILDREHGRQTVVATVNLYVNLPHNFRGTHMSRFVEVLNEYHELEWNERIGEILGRIRESLDADEAHMEVEFDYFIEKKAPVTGSASLMAYTCRFTASHRNGEDFVLCVTVPVITLCPCSKEISSFGAHNQRCMVTVRIRYTEMVWIEELVDLIEASSSGGLYSILKRPDEKYVTERAYNTPMFVEDVVREVAGKLDAMDRVVWYAIEADSQESIHNHNAYACLERQKIR
ncbi:MAG: GTP cyclohydrolase FolE2 [Candidatus Latescibacterota bacterium]